MIKHHSNGRHRIAHQFETSSDSGRIADAPGMQDKVKEVREVVVAQVSDFIRQRPGTSLIIAAAIGGVVGWLIKRRI
jgi:ElaB/YqjD/DUF883 family membrane-anchored ribosome-binding protein